jgi:hypothetical protein
LTEAEIGCRRTAVEEPGVLGVTPGAAAGGKNRLRVKTPPVGEFWRRMCAAPNIEGEA